MRQIWRIGKARYAATLFSGEGSLLVGGRWHHQGECVVYTSESHSLAQLESLVHFRRRRKLPPLVEACALVPDGIRIEEIDLRSLPARWNHTLPYDRVTADLGSAWFQSQKSAVLRVPSALARGSNYLLNPLHPDFKRIQLSKPSQFRYDLRLLS